MEKKRYSSINLMNSLLCRLKQENSEVTWWYRGIANVAVFLDLHPLGHQVQVQPIPISLCTLDDVQLILRWPKGNLRVPGFFKQVFGSKIVGEGLKKPTVSRHCRHVPSLGVHPSRVAQCLRLISHQTFDRLGGRGCCSNASCRKQHLEISKNEHAYMYS